MERKLIAIKGRNEDRRAQTPKQKLLCPCRPTRHSEGYVPDRPGRHPNCGGGGDVLHHVLRLHRRPAREHSPPQDGNRHTQTLTGPVILPFR